MTTAHHLPWDVARCSGVAIDGLELWRWDCSCCLRRLVPGHPDPSRTSYITPLPAPCPHHIPAADD